MAKVKIKRSKNLRFQLISLLYLVFLAISAIQIPDEWIRINKQFNKYFGYINAEKSSDPILEGSVNSIADIEEDFLNYLGLTSDNEIPEPKGYSKTDHYFINEKYGYKVHTILWNIDSTLEAGNTTYKDNFNKLFAEDIQNGLKNENGHLWVRWKFEHVPGIIALALMEEIKIRLNLLAGVEEGNKNYNKPSLFLKLAFNTDQIYLGDTVILVLESSEKFIAWAKRNSSDSIPLNLMKNDSLLFVPEIKGNYNVFIKSEKQLETFNINVLAANFISSGTISTLPAYFQGQEVSLKYGRLFTPFKFECKDCSSKKINTDSNTVSFTAQESGWNHLKFYNNNNSLILQDSIFIYETPEPLIRIDGLTNSSLSFDRLTAKPKIEIEAFHPKFNGDFKISNIQYSLLGAQNKSLSVNEGIINLAQEDINKIEYLVINSIEVSTPFKKFQISKPQIIRILRS